MLKRDEEFDAETQRLREEYQMAIDIWKRQWENYVDELAGLFGGEIPEFISDDYIDMHIDELSPQEMYDIIKEESKKWQ